MGRCCGITMGRVIVLCLALTDGLSAPTNSFLSSVSPRRFSGPPARLSAPLVAVFGWGDSIPLCPAVVLTLLCGLVHAPRSLPVLQDLSSSATRKRFVEHAGGGATAVGQRANTLHEALIGCGAVHAKALVGVEGRTHSWHLGIDHH